MPVHHPATLPPSGCWKTLSGSHAGAGLAENEANCTFAPAINRASERLLEDSTNLPADFQARQRFFAQQRKAHLQRIAAQSVGITSSESCHPHSIRFVKY